MSTPETGLPKLAADNADAIRARLLAQRNDLAQQELIEPLSQDDLFDARQELGPDAGNVAVLAHARARRAGRPKGARNRRSEDLEKYLRPMGPDPLVNAYIIAGSDPYVLMENSRRIVQKVLKNGDVVKVEESMSFQEAMALIARYSEMVLPYIHQKKPVQVDATIRHDGDLIIAGETHSVAETASIIEAEFIDVDALRPDFGEDEAA